ncbi:MAG TPA: hypothetical protein VF796_08000, partial [Humisphaera sp.]
PLGWGLGSTSRAGAKLGGGNASSEMDIGDMFMALGLVGGSVYLWVCWRVAAATVGGWQRGRSPAGLMAVGVLTCQFGNWLMGGNYATSALAWLLIGCVEAGQRAVAPASREQFAASVRRRRVRRTGLAEPLPDPADGVLPDDAPVPVPAQVGPVRPARPRTHRHV